METAGSVPNKISNPLWLLAELTYKCPLHCVFCYNPVDYTSYGEELGTEDWLRVLRQSRELGATQLGLSGGEPLMRDDLEIIVREARQLGYYSNLITSGIGLTEKRLAAFKEGGLDHIQISFQDSSREMNDFISSTKTFELKSKVAQWVKEHEYPIVLNVVLHRMNIDHIAQILEMAERMEVEYLELANTQYYGWGFVNRDHLLPTRDQVERAEHVTNEFRARIGDRMKIYFVVPDYHSNRPKACMNGWGSVFVTVTADGLVLPCHEARMLPGLTFPSVRDHDMRWIWYDSPGFNAYRGDSWMKEPCRDCPDKAKDFGGCRCQAFMLTGDATNADPVCDLSPYHHIVTDAVDRANVPGKPVTVSPILFRDDRNSRQLVEKKQEPTTETLEGLQHR